MMKHSSLILPMFLVGDFDYLFDIDIFKVEKLPQITTAVYKRGMGGFSDTADLRFFWTSNIKAQFDKIVKTLGHPNIRLTSYFGWGLFVSTNRDFRCDTIYVLANSNVLFTTRWTLFCGNFYGEPEGTVLTNIFKGEIWQHHTQPA